MPNLAKGRVGRKPLSASGKANQIHISFGDELETRLKQYCAAYNLPLSAFIRMCVEKELNMRINNG